VEASSAPNLPLLILLAVLIGISALVAATRKTQGSTGRKVASAIGIGLIVPLTLLVLMFLPLLVIRGEPATAYGMLASMVAFAVVSAIPLTIATSFLVTFLRPSPPSSDPSDG